MTWESDTGRDVTSVFQGITAPLRELYDEIHQRGWTVNKIDIKDGTYAASIKNPYGETIEKTGPNPETALGHTLIALMRHETMRYQGHFGAWNQTWKDQLPDIAKAYAEAPIYDPKAAGAWKELGNDCKSRAEAIGNQIHVEVTDDPHPYLDLNEMAEDVQKKKHIFVTRSNAAHPVWSVDQVLAYRLVHDVLGHVSSGGDYGWFGENRATAAHMPLLSSEAQKALFTEAIGQAAYSNAYRAVGPQKISFLDDFLDEAQDQENAGHGPVHPSQSVIPGLIPEVPTQKETKTASREGWFAPSYHIPDDVKSQLHNYAQTLPWPEGSVQNNPRKYHVTGMYSGEGYQSPEHQEWVNSLNPVSLPARTASLESFADSPSAKGYPVVLRLDGPELLRHGSSLLDQGEQRGLPVSRFPGGYKPHVTLGYSPEPIQADPPNLNFNVGPVFDLHRYYDQLKNSRTASEGMDPNHGWESGIDPLEDNAFLWQREESGKDPLDVDGLRNAASRLDTGWYHYAHPDGTPDLDTQKQAVVNALRAVVLGQRKPFEWNARHLQGVQNIPAGVDDPLRYFNALETQREAYNQARGLPEGIHRQIWAPEREEFYRWVKGLHPELDDMGVDRLARRQLFHMLAEEEQRIAADDPDAQMTSDEIANQAAEAMKKRLRVMTKPRLDQKIDFGSQLLHHDSAGSTLVDPIYGNFLASHMLPIAGVSLNSDQLLNAAREDVADHRGSGHHFRQQAMKLVPGIGAKEASLAWLLLQPHTSQLGVVDPTLADTLGHKPDQLNDRDYFKHERELAAGRDAAGYGHVPLGQFGWGLWDYAKFGHGVHRDHTPLRVIDPTPHTEIDWGARNLPESKWSSPYWWDSTKKAREDVGKNWDRGVATHFPKDEIPLQKVADAQRYPWFLHHETGEEVAGEPGTSIMQHARNTLGLSTEDVWKLNLEAGKR